MTVALRPHGPQHIRFPCSSLSPRVCSISCNFYKSLIQYHVITLLLITRSCNYMQIDCLDDLLAVISLGRFSLILIARLQIIKSTTIRTLIFLITCDSRNSISSQKEPLLGVNHNLPPTHKPCLHGTPRTQPKLVYTAGGNGDCFNSSLRQLD